MRCVPKSCGCLDLVGYGCRQGLQLERLILHVPRLGDRLIGDLAVDDIESEEEGVVVLAGLPPAFVGQGEGIAQRGIAEGRRRGVGHGTRHVGHGIVEDAVDGVDGMVVRGGMGGLEATALVDGHVDEDRAGLHVLEHLARDEVGRLRSGDQGAAHDDVGIGELGDDVVG